MKRYFLKIASCFLILLMFFNNSFSQEKEIKYGKISEGKRSFVDSNKMGFVDSNGKLLILPTFFYPEYCDDEMPSFKDGLCLFYEKNDSSENSSSFNYGFINTKFEIVIPAIFQYWGFYCDGFPAQFIDGRAIVSQSSTSYILIDKQGKSLGSPFGYSIGYNAACLYYPEIAEGLIAASNDDHKFGYLNPRNGKLSIPYKFSLAGPFSEGLAVVEYNHQYISFIDKSGNNITNKRYYTKKRNSKNWSLYNGTNDEGGGDGHPGKFLDGKVIIRYYDNEGYGKLTFAIIDKKGNVIKKSTYEKYMDDPEFKKIIDLGNR